MTVWNVNVDNIVTLKLVKTKTNSKHLIRYLKLYIISYKVIRQLVLMLPKMSRYVKTFNVKNENKGKNK